MKDPDTLTEACVDAAENWAKRVESIDDDERSAIAETRAMKLSKLAGRWFRDGEYLIVEIDTEAKTCTVIEVGK